MTSLAKRCMIEEEFDPSTEDLIHKLRIMSIAPQTGEEALIRELKCMAVVSTRKELELPREIKKQKRYMVPEGLKATSSLYNRNSELEELTRRALTKK